MSLFRLLSALVFVLALVLLAAWLARRVQGGSLAARLNAGRRLTISEQLYLSPKHRLVLVRCDTTEHLLLLSGEKSLIVESKPAAVSGGEGVET